MDSLTEPKSIHSLHFGSWILEYFLGAQLNGLTAQSLGYHKKTYAFLIQAALLSLLHSNNKNQTITSFK
jgi:hypothetical protein